MDEWKDKVRKILHPLMMCSVEQRYQLFYNTKFGHKSLSNLDLQGATGNVSNSVVGFLMRFGGEKEFLEEFSKIPKPEWYKG